MTDNENKSKLERKLDTYRYLFAHGNESPTEQQVELWIEYLDGRSKKDSDSKPDEIVSPEENVKRKIDLLKDVGLSRRAEKLEQHLLKSQQKNSLTGVERHIQQMADRVKRYHPQNIFSQYHSPGDDHGPARNLLYIILHDYLSTQNPYVMEAVRDLHKLAVSYGGNPTGVLGGRGYPFDKLITYHQLIPSVLFDLEHLPLLGIENGYTPVHVSKEGYRCSMRAIKQKYAERRKEKKVTFLPEIPTVELNGGGSYKFVVLGVADRVEEKWIIFGESVQYHGDLVNCFKDRYTRDEFLTIRVCGGGRVNVTPEKIRAHGYSEDFGKASQETVEGLLTEYARNTRQTVKVEMGKEY